MSCGWLWGRAILMLEVEGLGVSYFDLRSANVPSMFTSATVFSSVISLLPPQIDSWQLPSPNWTDGFVMAVSLSFFAEFFQVKWCWAILNKPVNLLERVAPPECYWLQCFFMDLGFSGCRYLRHLFLSICHRWGLVQLYLAWFGGLEWCCSGLQLHAALTGEFLWSCYIVLYSVLLILLPSSCSLRAFILLPNGTPSPLIGWLPCWRASLIISVHSFQRPLIKLIPRVYFPWYNSTMLLLLPFHPSLNGPFKI